MLEKITALTPKNELFSQTDVSEMGHQVMCRKGKATGYSQMILCLHDIHTACLCQ